MTNTLRGRALRSARSPVVLATTAVATTSTIAAITLTLTDQGVWAVLVLGVALMGIVVGTTVTQQHRAMRTATSLRRIESAIAGLTDTVGADRGADRILAEFRTRADELAGIEERIGRQITKASSETTTLATDSARALHQQVDELNERISDAQQRIRGLVHGDQLAELSDRTERQAENAERRATQRQSAMVKFIKSTQKTPEQSDGLGDIQARLDEIVEMRSPTPTMLSTRDIAGPTASPRDIELVLAHLLAAPQLGTE